MTDLNDNTELELLELARQHDDAAFEKLFSLYRNMISAICRSHIQTSYPLITYDEALQASRIGLMSAVNYYREDRGVSLKNFVRLCCGREIRKWMKKESLYHFPNSQSMCSLDSTMKDDETVYLSDLVTDKRIAQRRPDDMLNVKTLYQEILKVIKSRTGFDEKVFQLYMEGYSYKEMAELLKVEKKKIDNTVYRIKKKIRDYLNSQY